MWMSGQQLVKAVDGGSSRSCLRWTSVSINDEDEVAVNVARQV